MQPDLAIVKDVVSDEHCSLFRNIYADLLGRVTRLMEAVKSVITQLKRQSV